MHYNYKYRLDPSEPLTETLLHHVDTCRQLYNHVLYLLNEADNIPARYEIQRRLPDLKTWWDDLNDIHSKVLQMVLKRVYDNLSRLRTRLSMSGPRWNDVITVDNRSNRPLHDTRLSTRPDSG